MPNTPLPALGTVAELAGRLGLAAPAGDPLATQYADALLDASGALRDAIGQPISPGTATLKLKVNENGLILIPISPVVSVTSVTDPNGTVLPNDGTAYDREGQRLVIFSAYLVPNLYGPVDPTYTVTFAHGWDPIPGEILRWVYVLAAAQLSNAAVGSLGVNGGANSVAIDDGKVTYADLSGMIPDRVQARMRAMYGGEQR